MMAMNWHNGKFFVTMVTIFAFVSFMSCKEKTVSSGSNSIIWRTDKPPIEKRIPLLVPFEACIWHGGQSSNHSRGGLPAPEEYFIRGFVKIPNEATKHLLKDFNWNTTKFNISTINKPTTTSIADEFLSSKELLESEDFMRKHTKKSSFSNGRLILSPRSNVLYFDLANL